ncbi:MAG: M48 family metalloprotease [Deltaproteobacteria bacterium]|nr:M48 family metalloprotease [Deltaproteobacteria bacterium]
MPIILLAISFGASAGTLFWLAYGLPGLISLTTAIVVFCHSLFIRCVAYGEIFRLALSWTGGILLAGGVAYGVMKALVRLSKAHRAIRSLPKKGAGSVVIVKDPSRIAFTFGLLRPRIYLSTGLLEGLDRKEVRAVFLHELCHKRGFDPLKLFILSVLRDSFSYIPLIKGFVGHAIAMKEHEADDSTVSKMKEPLSLASALLKLASLNNGEGLYAAHASIKGTDGFVAGRVRRLVGDSGGSLCFRPSMKTVVSSALITFTLGLALVWPATAALPKGKELCTVVNRAAQIEGQGEKCKAHCSTQVHAGHR